VAGGMSDALRSAAAWAYGRAWEVRRRCYAMGLARPHAAGARVVSVGNLTYGGTGKTTLVLHLAGRALERGLQPAVVCRSYRPGPAGWGDETLLHRAVLGDQRVFAGSRKWTLAASAARSGAALILVDDGFSHWPLERDLDLVLLDAADPWGGGKLLPAGRMREPHRALQRAGALIASRMPARVDPGPVLRALAAWAPAARLGAGRHRVVGARRPGGAALAAGARVRVVTATGNPEAVAASAREAGLEVTALSTYRDHHWFRPDQRRRERAAAARDSATVLLTAKDAVRWPEREREGEVAVLEVAWQWVHGGEEIEALVWGNRA
jgi:tetraacyldisaccharide 4'-kinase